MQSFKKWITSRMESAKKNIATAGEVTERPVPEETMRASECPSQVKTGTSPVENHHPQQTLLTGNSLEVKNDTTPADSALTTAAISKNMENDARLSSSMHDGEIDATILDPQNSERQYYSDPYTGLQREIWRPGDGDGDKSIDYYEWSGPPPPLNQRWRFYQSPTGNGHIKRGVNEPPKYVVLDDRAAHEVYASDIYRKTLVHCWQHDFGGTGKIRARRPHRGRAAIGDPEAPGDERYHFGEVGIKNERYYFFGQKDYKPIVYRSAERDLPTEPAVEAETAEKTATVEELQKRKAPSPLPDVPIPKKKPIYNNQHTAPDKLVKNGAPGNARRKRGQPRLMSASRRMSNVNLPAHQDLKEKTYAQHPPYSLSSYDDGVESTKEKSTALSYQSTPVPDGVDHGSSSDMEEFPFSQRYAATSKANAATRASAAEISNVRPNHYNHLSGTHAGARVVDSIEDSDHSLLETASSASNLYVSRLESELADAKKTMVKQKAELDRLKHVQKTKGTKVGATDGEAERTDESV